MLLPCRAIPQQHEWITCLSHCRSRCFCSHPSLTRRVPHRSARTRSPCSENYRYFQRKYPRFLYVDRIAVTAEHHRRGVGRALYQHLLNTSSADYPILTCEVNLRPPNPGSLVFHERIGFRAVGEQETEGGAGRVCLMAMPLRHGA